MTRVERLAISLLYAFIFISIVGFASFGRNPALLASFPPWAAQIFAVSFSFFSQGQVWLALTVLLILLASRVGWKWITGFALCYALSFASEFSGTTTGFPFGPYAYTGLLGPKILGQVPVVIPLSWWLMVLPAYAIAARAFAERRELFFRILVSSFILMIWDLSLDPAMSFVTPYWTWGEPGQYYGMPFLNLFGWYLTGLVLSSVLAMLKSEKWLAKVSLMGMILFYSANVLLPIGMCIAAGLWWAVFWTALAGLPVVLLLRLRHVVFFRRDLASQPTI
jgi:uncharacterized membrane protein